MYLPLDEKFISKYLTTIIKGTGNSIETFSQKSKMSESTLKNLCSGKTENPGIITVATAVYAANGSLDAMFGKSKEDIDENTKNLMKEMYEFQLAEHRKTEETHIANIRSHYEQHRQDSMENYEKRLADKREIIDQKDEHIKTLKKENLSHKIVSWVCIAILVGLLIAEVMNPNLGWLRY